MNIAYAIGNIAIDAMHKTETGAFTSESYNRITDELQRMKNAKNYFINVENVQASDTHCYALFGDGSVLVVQAKGKISALTVSGA